MTTADDRSDHVPIAVIGAGQAGLATAYYLQHFDLDFTILADDDRVGDPWRDRWDSLRLFTPAFYNSLPGLEFPAEDPDRLPLKDEVAEYLERYADAFAFPLRLGTRVTSLQQRDGEFTLETSDGAVSAQHVVVATGAYSTPAVPGFADEVSDGIFTCHSSDYRNPEQLQAGDVLVVGAGNSGTQIATELASDARDRTVWLAGRDTGSIPRRLLGRDIFRWIAALESMLNLNRDSLLGRRLFQRSMAGGDPVMKPELAKMAAAGVERVGRIEGVEDGRPVSEDGKGFAVENVIWCTGFEPGFSWIDLDIFDADGRPQQRRGIAENVPGLYFVGLPWLHRPTSGLIGGVGPDAEHVARTIRSAMQSG